MARLYVESDDGSHRLELVADDDGFWFAVCDQHPAFQLYDRNRHNLPDAYEEAQQHVDRH